MVETQETVPAAIADIASNYVRSRPWPYRRWMSSIGIPIHKGYFIDDLRTIELGWWPERECNAAFLEMMGSEGMSEIRLTEIPPGKTLPAMTFALDEVVYVVEGRGLTTIAGSGPKKTFEWQKHSMFLIPRGHTHQFTNVQGDRPARLLHYNCLPLVMATLADPEFYFSKSDEVADRLNTGEQEFYSAAVAAQIPDPKLTWASGTSGSATSSQTCGRGISSLRIPCEASVPGRSTFNFQVQRWPPTCRSSANGPTKKPTGTDRLSLSLSRMGMGIP